MNRRSRSVAVAAIGFLLGVIIPLQPAAATHGGDTLVSVGSPTSPFSQNKQNEPAIAVDANHPNILAAGSNDNIDMEACNAGDPTTCPFTPGVGGSGIYFSFDSGDTWVQPTYTGLTARDCLGPAECEPHVGPIGTLPWYYENGLVSDGDPALAFGPVPDEDGEFSWDNGSRLYYANLAGNLGGTKGFEAIGVSRTDDVVAAAAGDKSAWMPPVIASKQSSTTFSDKEQIWADNAATSEHFGNVYTCWASFRSNSQGNATATPLIVSTSTDGGDTWTVKQVTDATNNPFNPRKGFGRSGCTIRTDSNGVVYVFAYQFQVGLPGTGHHVLTQSFDGGRSWTKLRTLFEATDGCWEIDPVNGRCVSDGVAGARNDLQPVPSVDIANGAPTGADATDLIVNTYVDAADGLNDEHVVVRYSDDGAATWSGPVNVETAGDRGFYSAPALSPDGTDLYLVYNAFTTDFQETTATPRGLVGVVLHAEVGASGPHTWSVLHRGSVGDPRASSQNNLVAEFLGDYVYAIATRTYGAAVWNDVRNGAVCTAINEYRQALQDEEEADAPAVQDVCPAAFGNTDIFGGSYADPS